VEKLLAVLDEPKIVDDAALRERVRGEHAVLLVVVGQQDHDRFAGVVHEFLVLGAECWVLREQPSTQHPAPSTSCCTGSVTINVLPIPGVLRAVIVPPCRSAILRQIASPIPVPS